MIMQLDLRHKIIDQEWRVQTFICAGRHAGNLMQVTQGYREGLAGLGQLASLEGCQDWGVNRSAWGRGWSIQRWRGIALSGWGWW